MADVMMFPDTVEEFMEQYKIVDRERVYTNGMEFVPIFRMEQWFAYKRGRWVIESDSEPYTEYVCSACGIRASSFIGGTEMWYCLSKPNYCPNCGAKMGVDE